MRACRRVAPPARTYYMDASAGSDSNPGTSTPWQTLAKLNGIALQPGDRVVFTGTWSGTDGFVPPTSGTPSRPIQFIANGTAIINHTGDYGISVSGKHHLSFEGIGGSDGKQTYHIVDSYEIYVRRASCSNTTVDESSINVTSSADNVCHDIHIEYCTITNTPGWGITAGGTYVVNKMIVDHCTITGIAGGGAVQHHAIYFTNVTNLVVKGCVIDQPYNGGVKLVQSGGKTTSGLIYRNKITRYNASAASGIGVSLDGVSGGVTIACNHIADGNATGLAMGIGVVNTACSNIFIYNNTIVRNYLGINMDLTPSGWIVKNNNIVQDYAWIANSLRCCIYIANGDIVNNTFQDNNYFFNDGAGSRNPIKVDGSAISFATWQGKSGSPDSTGTSVDPLFVTEFTDLHLQSGSTIRDSASVITGVESDVDGVPLDASPDVGAYQYV